MSREQTIFNLQITINDTMDCYDEEVVIKNLWPSFVPFMTKRHGVDKGKIVLGDEAVILEWNYTSTYGEEEHYD